MMKIRKIENKPFERRLNEEDKLAILIETERGVKVIETCDSIADLRTKYSSYSSFANSTYYPGDTNTPFAVSFYDKIDFNGELRFKILKNETIFGKPWKPTLREILIPYSGSLDYAARELGYFRDVGWPLMSPHEMREKEKKDPSFANSEQFLTWKKFDRISSFLAVRDVTFLVGVAVPILAGISYLGGVN